MLSLFSQKSGNREQAVKKKMMSTSQRKNIHIKKFEKTEKRHSNIEPQTQMHSLGVISTFLTKRKSLHYFTLYWFQCHQVAHSRQPKNIIMHVWVYCNRSGDPWSKLVSIGHSCMSNALIYKSSEFLKWLSSFRVVLT